MVIAADLTDAEADAVAGLIEASDPVRLFGYTTQQEDSVSAVSTTDTAYLLKNKNYRRTFTIFSSDNPYSAASVFGRAFSVNFMGTNTTITLKFKQLPGIAAEDLKIGEANNLNQIHFSGNLGLGLKYSFWKKLDARIEPVFKYQIRTFTNDVGDFKPYVFGVYSGVSYTF